MRGPAGVIQPEAGGPERTIEPVGTLEFQRRQA